jgi:H+/Cl- antiporter ClcA
VLAGLSVVAFTWATEQALRVFAGLRAWSPWWPLAVTPLVAAAVVWFTRRFAAGAAGSGIPQVMAALDARVAEPQVSMFVSLRLAAAKFVLTTVGLLGGLSLGREGPSVQLAAGVMHHARRWLPDRSTVSAHGLLVAGGAAGIAAAFNTPLAGVMFAIEELSRKPEQRSSGLLIAAIVLGGLMAVSIYGNATYFGVIQVHAPSLALLLPGLLVALASGLAGGVFSRLLVQSLGGQEADRFSRWRRLYPVRFAAGCGLAVAVIGLVSGGTTFGSGYAHSREMLAGNDEPVGVFVLFKFLATWITAWSGVPGGIFAPSLAIGGALGNDVASLVGYADAPTLIALGMVGFLAAATQAPLTSFIIVMEMVDGHGMVLSLMACALVAGGVSRILGRPLYGALAQIQLARLPVEPAPRPRNPAGGGSV